MIASAVPSLWEAVTPPGAARPALCEDIAVDTVIVGGGLSGLSAALTLAGKGQKTALMEAHQVGWGASGRNNGQIIPTMTAAEPDTLREAFGSVGEQFARLVGGSAAALFDLVRKENIDAEAEQTGWFQPAHSPGRMRLSAARVEGWQRFGFPARLVEREEACAMLGSDLWYGGMFNPTGGHINPLAFARGLASAAEKAGATIYENSPAVSWKREGSFWHVKTEKGSVKAKNFLLLTNAYTGKVVPSFASNFANTIVPILCWQVATAPLSEEQRKEILPGRQAVSDTHGDLRFFRYDARNRLITGGAVLGSWNAARRVARKAGAMLAEAYPSLAPPAITHVWSGYLGMTPDRLPRVHNFGPGAWTWIGCNGRGVALSVALGREIARAVSGEPIASLALPLSNPIPLPFHSLTCRIAPFYLTWLQRQDRQEIA
ncbi:NAD(P)/FAD-dependent oxidoreductase [Acetobacter sp.]|uniref:NAD(P)/FAD-dependent oxidoreductase n=1 Tax=Acetobacter sp. TaxID=440 RepID=UPI0039EA9092